MLVIHAPLADQFARMRIAAAEQNTCAWVPDTLHALIMACLIRLFGHLEHLVQLWQSGQLPPLISPPLISHTPISHTQKPSAPQSRRRHTRAVHPASPPQPRAPIRARRIPKPNPTTAHPRSAPPARRPRIVTTAKFRPHQARAPPPAQPPIRRVNLSGGSRTHA